MFVINISLLAVLMREYSKGLSVQAAGQPEGIQLALQLEQVRANALAEAFDVIGDMAEEEGEIHEISVDNGDDNASER